MRDASLFQVLAMYIAISGIQHAGKDLADDVAKVSFPLWLVRKFSYATAIGFRAILGLCVAAAAAAAALRPVFQTPDKTKVALWQGWGKKIVRLCEEDFLFLFLKLSN